MTRPTINSMITEDLGYCCEYFFFSLYRQTSLIAARLGVSPRTIRYHKAASKRGQVVCEKKDCCMKKKR